MFVRSASLVSAAAVLLGSAFLAGPTVSRPSTTHTTVATASAPATQDTPPGRYRFVGKVEAVGMGHAPRRYVLNGVYDLSGERIVFAGADASWVVTIKIASVERTVWFLKAGRRVKFVVHRPTLLFREDAGAPVGKTRHFELEIRRNDKGDSFFSLSVIPDAVSQQSK
jgi:hypothetical protein